MSLSELIGAPAAAASGVAVVMRKSERPVFRDPETGFERHIVSAAPGALFFQTDADHGFANRTSDPCEYIMVVLRRT